MKRHLKNDRYRLDEHEAGNLWYAVRRELTADDGLAAPRARAWRPILATAAVVAVAAVTVAWWLDGRVMAPTSDSPLIGNALEVAELEVAELEAPKLETPKQAGPAEVVAPPAAVTDADDRAFEPKPVAASSRGGVISGRVIDRSDGSPVAHASVTLIGTTRGVTTDSTGAFRFGQLEPGRHELQVVRLGYAPLDVAVNLPDHGQSTVSVGQEPIVVATLESFEVAGEEYMVEIKSAVTELTARSETFEKYAIGSVEDALSKEAGVVYRAGELYVRGGRSGEVSMKVDGAAVPPSSPGAAQSLTHVAMLGTPPRANELATAMVAPGSITGGTTPPNGETFESMYFKHSGVNPFVATGEDSLSTFALDVDNASFTLARSYLDRRVLPPAEAIRVEEFVNALDAGWKAQTKDTFRIGLDGGPSRFGQGYHLLRVGIVGRSVPDDQRKPANLVFVIDISGSMNRESRLGSVKRALRILVDELDEGDRVGIVVYGSRGEVRLPMTDASHRREILEVIDGLAPNGSTNAAEGLTLGYQLARENRRPGGINRLILCSDGVANTGVETDAEGILQLARRGSDHGVTLSTVGFGMGNYNDVLMEKLADQGDGNYYYVDRPEEAERVFRENLTGLLQTIAREAKVQVEFDARHVARWRLLGYENRDVADRDFRNDAVDAGEVGAGHQVTALYEVKLAAGEHLGDDAKVGIVRLRWEAPEHDPAHAGQVTEIERPIARDLFESVEQSGTPQRRAQALAAEFAEILRGSYWARESRLSDLVPVAEAVAGELPADTIVQDLARMIRRAADLQATDDREPRGDDGE